MSKNNLIAAVEVMGSQTALAEALRADGHHHIKQQHIFNWLTSKRPELMPPAEFCRSIEAATQAKGMPISRYELRPDVFGADPKVSSSGVASA